MEETKKKILFVEDQAAILLALSETLEKAGFEVIIAPDGLMGRDLALAEHPDLIVLDVIMPKMDGITLYNTIRNDQWGSQVRIIFLTNVTGNPKLEEASKHPLTQLVMKNEIILDDFTALVKKTLA